MNHLDPEQELQFERPSDAWHNNAVLDLEDLFHLSQENSTCDIVLATGLWKLLSYLCCGLGKSGDCNELDDLFITTCDKRPSMLAVNGVLQVILLKL